MEIIPNNIKVIIAEDDFLIAEEISRILKKLGYQVAGVASNGLKAIELAQTIRPDVILMDIKMPKMNGLDAAKQIMEETSAAIVILTAHESKDLVEKASEAGIGAYLTKPPKMEEIDRAITIAIARHCDLVESRRLVKQLENSEKKLHEINATKDRFFSIIAHDLRNPVAALAVFAGQLNETINELSKEELKQYISIINQTSHGLSDLLEELLLWASLQMNRYEFNPVNVNLLEIVQSVKSLMSANAIQKNISLQVTVDETIYAFADYNMVQTIIRNLVSNAIKFTPINGSITINYTLRDNDILITVSDTGVGISTLELANLFKINHQHSTPGTAGEQGTGLGLILCREMVERNQGSIWATSKPRSGSSFTISLPKC